MIGGGGKKAAHHPNSTSLLLLSQIKMNMKHSGKINKCRYSFLSGEHLRKPKWTIQKHCIERISFTTITCNPKSVSVKDLTMKWIVLFHSPNDKYSSVFFLPLYFLDCNITLWVLLCFRRGESHSWSQRQFHSRCSFGGEQGGVHKLAMQFNLCSYLQEFVHFLSSFF